MDSQSLVGTLVKNNLLSAEAGSRLLKEATLVGKPVEELIAARRMIGEADLARVKSEILNVPFERVKPEDIPEELLKLVPQETVQTYKLIPISRDKDLLVVGMVNPDDARAQDALRFIAKSNKLSIGVYLITPGDWELALQRYSPYKSEIEAAVRSLAVRPGQGLSASARAVSLDEGRGGAEDAPIIRIVASTLKEAVQEKASDIHIEPLRGRTRIRFRIDGSLAETASFTNELHQPIISRVKILADLKIDETRIPQDGRFRTTVFGRDIDFRVSTFPTPLGEKAAIRVLDPTIGLKGTDALGLVGKNSELVARGLERPFGMILITGPTGSGKTTTLYALLQELNKIESNVVSLEDPVEYFVEGVNQSQVMPEIGYDFASGLRQILRQDPDVIMVGEIRDAETALLAVHAALTGHIVLSTLHTNNAVGVVPRLVDMGVQTFLLPSAVNLMISQRLVARLCDNCKRAEKATGESERIVANEIAKLPPAALEASGVSPRPPYEIYHAPGCEVCKGKGISGRVAIFEVLTMTPELKEIVAKGADEARVAEEAVRQGMITLRQDGVLKALKGIVSLEEILRETTEV